MKSNSPTAAGPNRKPEKQPAERVDAINQVFALFQLNYHNQYHKAFGDLTNLNHAKRLWLEMLERFESGTILRAAKAVIESSEYLPTLRTMIKYCEQFSESGELPDAHSAYIEACRAPSPKAAHQWSHPAVYHAGKATDWFFLQSNAEAVAFPVFRERYEELCARVRAGETLSIPRRPALAPDSETPLDNQENARRLDKLRRSLDL